MALIVYNVLLFLFSPLIGLLLLWRLWRGKEDAAHWGERWGRFPENVARDTRAPRFWVHAVSVGEVMAAVPVLRELRRTFPDSLIVLSTTTPGGREVALKQVPPADAVVYYPLDFPFAVQPALKTVRPDVILLMEWEIWPNFLLSAKRRGARIAVLNGRISDRGLRRGLRGRFFVQAGLDCVDRFCMQSAEDTRRAALVGAPKEKTVTIGNTKFDESSQMLTEAERLALRRKLGIPDDAPVLVCGSTRPGEEEIIADALSPIFKSLPNLYTIVAPRHLDRAETIVKIFEVRGLNIMRRSRGETGQTLLLDTFGELARLYAIADVAFVGGSLAPFGGQSVFQPLAQGIFTVFGPYMNNQRDIAALSVAEGVARQLTHGAELASAIIEIASLSPAEKEVIRQKARGLIERNQGVAARCVAVVKELLAQ